MKLKRTKDLYIVSIVLTFILISESCTKDRGRYELFPLKVGNIFYYQYSFSYDDRLVGNNSIGNEKWTVITDSIKNKNVEFYIEKKFNGIDIDWSILTTNNHRDTTIIKDRIDHFIIVENPSGELQFWDISFPMYNNNPALTISIQGSNMDFTKTYYFNAGSGLTHYYKSCGLMESQTRESYIYIQDSLKIAN
jgi:hypothetical protein